ncbi:MAG TPA: MGMT family protein [Methanocorpusculum sp.]|nr:MGMT family protein [Methanocorpusculum sp.]
MQSGSCSFELWRVSVDFDGNMIHRVRFLPAAAPGAVPVQFTRFIVGRGTSFAPLKSAAVAYNAPYSAIYRAVSEIPYGETRTYGEIAAICDTHARVVGNAMARNPTPLIVPCHRVVAAKGLGGFSPDIQIKEALLKMEAEHV